MQTLNSLIDAARAKCDRDSDRALAEAMKVTPTTVMEWRRGNRRITDEHLAALIQLAKADEATFVRVREEMAASPAERKTWRSLLDRMGAAAVVVAVGAAVIALAHPGAHEVLQAGLPLFAVNLPSIHYAKWRVGLARPACAGFGSGSRLAYPPGDPPIRRSPRDRHLQH